MSTLAELLEVFIDSLDSGDDYGLRELQKYTAESGAEQAVIDILSTYETALADQEKYPTILKETAESLKPLLDEPLLKRIKGQLYSLIVWLHQLSSGLEDALIWAEKFDAEVINPRKSTYLLTVLNLMRHTQESLLSAAGYADKLIELENGSEDGVGALLKIDALTTLGSYEEALAAVDSALYEKKDSRYLYKKFILFLHMREFDNALSLLGYFDTYYYPMFAARFLELFESGSLAAETVKAYIKNHPGEICIYAFIAEMTDSTDDKIMYYEWANKNHAYDHSLFRLYEKRGNPEDAEKYFEIAGRLFENKHSEWSTVNRIVYGPFARFDKDSLSKFLSVLEQNNPDYECALTLIGRAYEYGLGVDKNPVKAFEYYERAKSLNDIHCECGKLFHAYALLYGIGVAKDVETAKLETLELINGRNEMDRFCLYAVFALENDPRFSKEKAIELLKPHSENHAAPNILLYRLTKGTTDAELYINRFIENFDDCSYLEKQWLSTYMNNLDSAYIHLVIN